jgi:hypothetical protein
MSRICGVVVLVGAGSMLFAAGRGPATPEAAFKEFQAAIKAKDGERAWKLLSKEGQGQMEKQVEAMKESFKVLEKLSADQLKQVEEQIVQKFGVGLAELKKMDGRKLFALALKAPEAADKLKAVTSATLEDLKVEGDKATATVKALGKSEPIRFIREGGSWKITPPNK